ncbi:MULTISPECIES: ribonuclease D [unclassified Thioalkalivibrio]|uniref:ribonuclease D n=1 Tax=unclassified Thioalkalivibrio TaxID=2621013 RepID=UPI0004186C01|nr:MULTISPECIES: ribonuclease D [unclassified Thioalkalivibrio]PYG03181.1 ribonuclease D [Thioalkalivibrio sp. ALE21]
MHDHGLIDTPDGLQAFLQAVRGAPWIALDTEFLREKTYYPKLCLIQAATPEHIASFDPLALDVKGLAPMLHDRSVTKVFHSAWQDMEILLRETGDVPAPVFDTQIAAAMLGHGDQIGYANLVRAVLDHELDKSQTRTDWSRRPLDSEQLAYAADDVRYLAALYQQMHAELESSGRLEWLQPEMDALADPEAYRADPEAAWRRVSGHKRLKPRELSILQAVAAWRERTAQSSDRPRKWVLSDDLLLEIARRAPAGRAQLRGLRGFPSGMNDDRVQGLLEAIRAGRERPQSEWPALPKQKPLSEADEVLADMAMALLRELARRQEITPAAIAQRKDVVELVRGRAQDSRLGSGWRHHVAGAEIQRWLNGETALSRDPANGLELKSTAG